MTGLELQGRRGLALRPFAHSADGLEERLFVRACRQGVLDLIRANNKCIKTQKTLNQKHFISKFCTNNESEIVCIWCHSKVVLLTNVASYWGFATQYSDFNALKVQTIRIATNIGPMIKPPTNNTRRYTTRKWKSLEFLVVNSLT